ncbi:MAG: hypothetical protein NTV51_23270 [Verrucomicrobia bacterium]|nr:hypothetical protein [Verrucomicrobiota bacterium]
MIGTTVAAGGASSNSAPPSSSALLTEARTALAQALVTEEGWPKIHAAEALVAVGEGGPVRELFEKLAANLEGSPQRTGVWRVLAATARTPAERAAFIAKIEATFLNPASADRLQAIESLCKLGHAPAGNTRLAVQKMLQTVPENESALPLWASYLAGDPDAVPGLARRLGSGDALTRLRAAYALRWIGPKQPEALAALARAAEAEPADTLSYPYVVSAAYALRAEPARTADWQAKLDTVLEKGKAGGRYEACQALLLHVGADQLPRFAALLRSPEGDVRIGAAWAICALLQRPAR